MAQRFRRSSHPSRESPTAGTTRADLHANPGAVRAAALAAASYLVIASLLTHPLLVETLAGSGMMAARPESREDFYNHIWNAWYFGSAVASTGDGWMGHTRLLFFPEGLDLAFHTVSFVQVGLAVAFSSLLGVAASLNAAGLLLLVSSALAAYLLVLELTKDPWVAWFGGAVFAFHPWSLFHLNLHPDLMALAAIPLAVFAVARLHRPDADGRWAILGGSAIGLAGYSSLYVLVLTVVTMLFHAASGAVWSGAWRRWGWWRRMALTALVGCCVLLPRVGPLATSKDLDSVLSQKLDVESSVDVLRLALPYGHPWFRGVLRSRHLAGPDVSVLVPFVPLLLAGLGVLLVRPSNRGEVIAWIGLLLGFIFLTLGGSLQVGGHRIGSFTMPRTLLTDWFPLPFRAFRESKLYFPGVLLPLSIAASAGLAAMAHRLRRKYVAPALCVSVTLLSVFEGYLGPFRPIDLSASPFYSALRDEGTGALIELPFGRPQAKRYLFYQTLHGRPIQEGSVSREQPTARRFEAGNPLLSAWHLASAGQESDSPCLGLSASDWIRSTDQLLSVGFEYVVLHADSPRSLADSLADLTPVYRDTELAAFRIEDVRGRSRCALDAPEAGDQAPATTSRRPPQVPAGSRY